MVGGANGANRLSGNAITEALVFGRRAGRSAADACKAHGAAKAQAARSAATLDLVRADAKAPPQNNTAAMVAHLQAVMADDVGPFRTGTKLAARSTKFQRLPPNSASIHPATPPRSICERLEWFDLRNMLTVADAVTITALARTESRGAHQREDFPTMLPQWQVHQTGAASPGRDLKISGAPAGTEALAS